MRSWLVVVRGPSGAGKTSLCRAWAKRPPFHFGLLSTDDVQEEVDFPELSDEEEFELVLGRIGSLVEKMLAEGSLLLDAGLRDAGHVDRVLSRAGRKRGDPDVVLVRLTVGTEEAIHRKADLPEARVRELHSKWQTQPVDGETVLATEGRSAEVVSRQFGEILARLLQSEAPRDPSAATAGRTPVGEG